MIESLTIASTDNMSPELGSGFDYKRELLSFFQIRNSKQQTPPIDLYKLIHNINSVIDSKISLQHV